MNRRSTEGLTMLRKMLTFIFALLGLIVGPAQTQAQTAAQRHALVIGNDGYRHIGPLINSRSDARAIASTLEGLGYRVSLHTDVDLNGLKVALRNFRARVNGGDEAIFFFAGHGVEIEGVNYLLPIDIQSESAEQVRDDAIPLQRVLDDLRERRVRFSLAIVDACRSNPFRGAGRSIGGRGLAATTAATGQMVLYSAGAGQEALDHLGPGDTVRNGVFTRVLLREMVKPGIEVGEVMRTVRNEVASMARSVGHDQVPALYDQTLGTFYFQPARPAAASAAPVTAPPPGGSQTAGPAVNPAAAENQFWSDVRAIDNAQAYDAYLAEYPKGRYAPLARAALARLAGAATATGPTSARIGPQGAAATAPPVAKAASGTVFRDCDECPEMVVVPGGNFEMGAAPGEEEAEGVAEEFRNQSQPRRRVEVASFAAGRFEVTRGQYRAFVQATAREGKGCLVWDGKDWSADAGKDWRHPGYPQDDGHPVTCVSWEDAKAYVGWLSLRSGHAYRLLTEAEWEYSARAGTVTRRYWGDDGNHSCTYANTLDRAAKRVVPGAENATVSECDDGHAYTSPVGRYQPNAFGLHDMLGNVWEWVEDCWNKSYAGAPADSRARTDGDCAERPLRGGSWSDDPSFVRAADRSFDGISERSNFNGFRIARDSPQGVAAAPAGAGLSPALAAEIEKRFWADVREIGNREAYDAYLARYPTGQFALLARAAIARLSAAAGSATSPAPSPAAPVAASASVTSSPAAAPPVLSVTPPASATPPVPSPARSRLGAVGTVFKDCDECPEMVVVPGANFEMGAAPGEEEAEGLSEQERNQSQPRRMVGISPFAAGRFEVTRGQYRAFAQATGRQDKACWVWDGKEWVENAAKSWREPGFPQDDGHPVTCVSWEDAKAYVAWLSSRTGQPYRLLTEAEWEYAARAGTSTRRYWGNRGGESCAHANSADRSARPLVPGASNWEVAECDDGHAYTATAGRYRANAFGLHDMLGNVSEWVEDCWSPNYAGAPSDGRARTQGDCGKRVMRGGSWFNVPVYVRAAYRSWGGSTRLDNEFGFRVARSD
jgi:formylglycine-generating enzyme required for sulfatase activity